MPEREREPIFCSECQNQITKVETARVLDGSILCPADLRKRSFIDRIRARKLPEDFTRRGGVLFRSFFTSLAALMLVVGVAFIWRQGNLPLGVTLILSSVFVLFFGVLAGDIVDLLLDIFEQLKLLNRSSR